jgi:hypothetical protein
MHSSLRIESSSQSTTARNSCSGPPPTSAALLHSSRTVPPSRPPAEVLKQIAQMLNRPAACVLLDSSVVRADGDGLGRGRMREAFQKEGIHGLFQGGLVCAAFTVLMLYLQEETRARAISTPVQTTLEHYHNHLSDQQHGRLHGYQSVSEAAYNSAAESSSVQEDTFSSLGYKRYEPPPAAN